MAAPTFTVPLIETPRLRLRPFVASDAAGLHEAFGDPEAMRYWDAPVARDLAVTQKNVEWLMRPNPDFHAAWAVTVKAGEAVLGMVNYHHREARHRRLEIGYVIRRLAWRQGFAAEAVAELLAHCFGTLDAHRVEALIAPDNRASIGLAERLGFRCEGGPLRDRWAVGGEFRSAMIYALLEDDWRRSR
jgi:ribosomal-protein-alanine N-acetyltransferase